MSITNHAREVLTRPLPQDKIHKRAGKAGMEFSYITPDFVIETLNEAFGSAWGTRIVTHLIQDNVAIVGLELSVPTEGNAWIVKQQFGSCEINRGMDVGSALKGAASDALKKCATLLGLGLELYKDDDVVTPGSGFSAPQVRTSPPAAPRAAPAPTRPPVAPPRAPAAPSMPSRPAVVTPPAPRAAVPPVSFPKDNPFGGDKNVANVSKPTPPRAPAAPRENPFANNAQSSEPNSTQLVAMSNLAARKNLSPADLIALAGVTDAAGSPVQSFEELTREQAIQVIKTAQF